MTGISLPSERPFRMRVRDELESLVPTVVKPLADVLLEKQLRDTTPTLEG
jgi:hypothetical protein